MSFDIPQRMYLLLITLPSLFVIFMAWIFLPKYVPAAFIAMVVLNLVGLYTIAGTLKLVFSRTMSCSLMRSGKVEADDTS